jgi:sec-independent protein translocase protein TatA
MLRNIGGPEIIVILVVVLLLFGATRLPALARSIGQSARELREGLKEGASDDESAENGSTPKDSNA